MKSAFSLLLLGVLLVLSSCGQPKADAESGKSTGESETAKVTVPVPFKARFDTLLKGSLPGVAVQIVPLPDDKSFLVLGRDGQINHYDQPLESLKVGETTALQPRMKLVFDDVYAGGDLGSIGMALDPHFVDNRFFYVWCADKKDENVYLERFALADDAKATLASRTRIIGFSRCEPEGPYHMGGIVQFLPDESLLLMVGDAEHPHISQDQKNLNGKILRIIPGKGPEGGYTVPANNPHVGDDAWLPEIVATGLRAPFRGYLHQNRDFFIADVGAVHEEINHWRLDPTKAVDFGWGLGETGKITHPLTDGVLNYEGSIDPIINWTREVDFSGDDPEYAGETRMSAGVGVVYGSSGKDRYAGALSGQLIFFEIMRGWVRSAVLDGEMKATSHRHIGHMPFLSHMVEGRDGYLYALTWGPVPGIYRIVSENAQAMR